MVRSRRWVLGLVGVVAVLAVGGIGFAAFTSTATIQGTVSSGTFGPLTWDSGSPGIPSPVASETCSSAGVGSNLTISGAEFAPGESCTVTDVLTNHGTLPGLLTETYSLVGSSASCPGSEWTYTDTISSAPAPGVPIAAGGSVSDTITIGLSASAGNPCQDQSVALTATVTGTAT